MYHLAEKLMRVSVKLSVQIQSAAHECVELGVAEGAASWLSQTMR
jgi:hypothetical protein